MFTSLVNLLSEMEWVNGKCLGVGNDEHESDMEKIAANVNLAKLCLNNVVLSESTPNSYLPRFGLVL